jgi:hypothetical protein
MFRAPPRPSSGAYNCISSLWFYHWSVVVAALLVMVWLVNRLSHRSSWQPEMYVKPEAAITVFELLMMGGVSPETF